MSIDIMERIASILLLSMVSLWMSSAATTGFCQHEQDKAAQHYGRHEHKHEGFDGATLDNYKVSDSDNDGVYCHLSFARLIGIAISPMAYTQGSARVERYSSSFSSYIPGRLPRPNCNIPSQTGGSPYSISVSTC